MFKSVKEIYDSVSVQEENPLENSSILTNMEKLTEGVKKYAEDRKLEIEKLRLNENYRKEYLGNVAHELKTPLFTVQGYILTLLDGAVDDVNVRSKYLERAGKGVDRLVYLVNDLDLITKLESGNLNLKFSTFDIVQMVRDVFEMLEIKASRKNISLTLDNSFSKMYVHADEERIEQVLTNLIENSIKYGTINGTTEVGIQELIKGKILMRVTDNGEGITAENIPRLFERFFRVDKSGNRKVTGSGLGLSIVKHIVEAHEEKIYVDSELGVGSEFSFTIEKAQ